MRIQQYCFPKMCAYFWIIWHRMCKYADAVTDDLSKENKLNSLNAEHIHLTKISITKNQVYRGMCIA